MTTTTAARLDDCLSTRDGHLFVEQCHTGELVRRFGSPLFVVSEDQIRRNVRAFLREFQRGWPDGEVQLLPAAKASWITAVQRILASEGCGCDVYSSGELSVALAAGFEPRRISVNGVPKDAAHIRRCVAEGVRLTIDSLEELDIIAQSARELGQAAEVRLRLKPALSGFTAHSHFVAEGLVPTDIAAIAYKGGLQTDDAIALGRRILELDGVELMGFHQHHGRHHPSTRYWEEQMKAFARELGVVCQALGGFQPREIDIGGGFAIPRDPFNAVTDYTEPLQLGLISALSKGLELLGPRRRYGVLGQLIERFIEGTPNQLRAPSVAAYADACTATLRQHLPRQGIDLRGLTLQLEPGRSIHGNTGIHLTTVRSLKRQRTPYRWDIVIVDTTEFWFTGGRYEHHLHDYVFAGKTDAPMVGKADIIGRSCYGDRLMPMVPIPEVQVGDLLALLDTGAYQEVSMSNFNAIPRPATVLVTGGSAAVIRRRETDEEVFARDVIPEHLRRQYESPAEDAPQQALAGTVELAGDAGATS